MKPSAQPVLRDLVLVGGGHSHVGVLRMFAMKPEPGVRITVICTDIDTPYSGMLPGYISGHYSFDEVHIDLGRLCAFAGARLYHDAVVSIDRQNKQVICRNRPAVAYDVLSINIGSTPQMKHVEGASSLAVPVKPIAQFNQRWLALLDKARQWPTYRGCMTIAVVGGGDSACEEAVYLTKYGSQVHLIVRRDALRASKAMADRVLVLSHRPGTVKAIYDIDLGVAEDDPIALRRSSRFNDHFDAIWNDLDIQVSSTV